MYLATSVFSWLSGHKMSCGNAHCWRITIDAGENDCATDQQKLGLKSVGPISRVHGLKVYDANVFRTCQSPFY